MNSGRRIRREEDEGMPRRGGTLGPVLTSPSLAVELTWQCISSQGGGEEEEEERERGEEEESRQTWLTSGLRPLSPSHR